MKRLLAGAGLAAAIVSGAYTHGGGEASAQGREICGTVYDTVDTGDQSGPLKNQIGIYATHGVEVHVQILEDGRAEGIKSIDDAAPFAERLADDCGWEDPDRINVVVSFDPRAYDVQLTDQAHDDISDATVDDAEDQFIADLRDESSSTQSDVANLLETINPYEQPVTPTDSGTNNTPSDKPSTPKEPFRMPDLPYEGIGLGIAAAAVLGAGAARTSRGITIRRIHEDNTHDANEALNLAMTATVAADAALAIIPDGDALEARAQRESIDDALAELVTGKTALDEAYDTQRKRLWPDADELGNAADTLDDKAMDTTRAAGLLSGEVDRLNERIGTIDATIEHFGQLIQSLEQAITTLEGDGWDMKALRQKLDQYKTAQTEIVELRKQNYVDRPADMADQLDDGIIVDTELATKLPSRLITIGETHTAQAQTIEQKRTDTTTATTALQAIKDAYDASCSDDIATYDERLAELVKALDERQAEAGKLVGKKSAESVDTAEQTQANISDIFGRIDTLTQEVHGRTEQLAKLSAELPDTFAELAQASTDGITTAHEFGNDTEPETHEALAALRDTIAETERGLGVDKPKLLELDDAAKKIAKNQKRLNEQARAEADEMRDLRHDIDSLAQNAESELSQLENYIHSHSDVDGTTESAARSIDLIRGNTSASRAGMRDQVGDLNGLLARIQQVQHDAKRDVQDAEDERRRQREEEDRRRRQREEDDRRRQASYSSSSSSFGGGFGGGSSFGGGGGGSSHHSSGF